MRFAALRAFVAEETKRHHLLKYVFLLIVVFTYVLIVVHRFGAGQGFAIAALTWTFFVFCTPVADAGFLLDFPIRLLTGLRMVYSESIVWTIAVCITIIISLVNPAIFQKTLILRIYAHIITEPWPNLLVVPLSAAGTFLSVTFGDELMDVSFHRNRERYHRHALAYHAIIMAFLIFLILIIYDFLLRSMNIHIPL